MISLKAGRQRKKKGGCGGGRVSLLLDFFFIHSFNYFLGKTNSAMDPGLLRNQRRKQPVF